jgi:hypothetical protein
MMGYAELNVASVTQILQAFDRNPSTAVRVDLECIFDAPGNPWDTPTKQRFNVSFEYDIFRNFI